MEPRDCRGDRVMIKYVCERKSKRQEDKENGEGVGCE